MTPVQIFGACVAVIVVCVLVIKGLSRPVNFLGNSNKMSFPMTHHMDNIIGSQYFTDVVINGNTYNVLVDTGSPSMNLQDYKKTGTKSSKPNKFIVYGGQKITPDQCQSSQDTPSVYTECAMIEWWNDTFNVVPSIQIGSVLYGGIPSIFGLSGSFDKSQGTFIWEDNTNLKNMTIDFPNGYFTINDDDTSGYDLLQRVSILGVDPKVTNNFYSVIAQTLTLNGTNLDTSKYVIIIDNGTSECSMPQELLDQMNDNETLTVKLSDNTIFTLNPGGSLGTHPAIIIGNKYYGNMKLYMDGNHLGFKIPAQKVHSRFVSVRRDIAGMNSNINKLRALGSKWQLIKYDL